MRVLLLPLLSALALGSPAAQAASASGIGERMKQRLVERHAEALLFPALIERCRTLPELRDAPLAAELGQWRERRGGLLAEAKVVVEQLANAQGQQRAGIDEAIRKQALARLERADTAVLAYTCARLRHTLRGEPPLPLHGGTLDEDTQRELLDQLLPVAGKLMDCASPERIEVRPAPPAALRRNASSLAGLADRVELWYVAGCGKTLEVEVSLRFPAGEPPTFALGFPRTAPPS